MTRLIAVLCLAGALAGPGAASAGTRDVRVNLSAFTPVTLNVILDDTVRWTSWDATGQHDVQGLGWSSGVLNYLDSWERAFDALGPVAYVCNFHSQMQGTIVVHHAFLRGPAATVTFGNAMAFNGLAAEGETVEIQREANGSWTTVGSVVSGGNDAFATSVKPAVPGRYRALVGGETSPEVIVSVKPRVTLAKKRLPKKRTRVTATAAPNRAGAVAVLQRKKPAGWAAIASKRLGTTSKAAFVVRPPKGTWRVRAIVKKSGGYAAGQSGVVAVKR